MTILRVLTIAAITASLGSSGIAMERILPKAPALKSAAQSEVLQGEYRLSQTATCLYDGKRYNKGARLCMGGVYNYCNSRGLWEPSNQTC